MYIQLCLDLIISSFYSGGMVNIDVINQTWDMINKKEGMIIYERTKFPKQVKPLLIDRLINILNKYRGKGIDNYVFPVYTETHVTDKQKMGHRNSIYIFAAKHWVRFVKILGIDEKMTWHTARGILISSELDADIAETTGNSVRTIGKYYYKNTQ